MSQVSADSNFINYLLTKTHLSNISSTSILWSHWWSSFAHSTIDPTIFLVFETHKLLPLVWNTFWILSECSSKHIINYDLMCFSDDPGHWLLNVWVVIVYKFKTTLSGSCFDIWQVCNFVINFLLTTPTQSGK